MVICKITVLILQLNGVSNYFDREVKRCAFVQQRWDFREKEKMRLENEAKAKAGVGVSGDP